MNVDIAKKGHSFKGAFAYYLHDKDAQTSERVAWAETRNLAHDDPAYAQSVMIATARQADELKRAAGVVATGRKATAGPVYAFALSWRADEAEKLDRAEMLKAADAALKVLEADHLQAVIVCHQDRDHPHVHVVINRVNPVNGISEKFSKDRDRLDEWADAYERERGQIVSPNRAKKYEDRRKRDQKKARKQEPQQMAPANHSDPAAARTAPPQGKSRAAMLAELQAAQKARHKQEWADLSAANKVRRAAIYAERVDFKGIAAQHRAQTRPFWSELGKAQAAERRAYLDRETRLSGIVRNAIDTVRSQKIRGVAEDQGFLVMCFNYTLSSQARRAAFDARQNDAKEQLAASVNTALTTKFDAVKAERGAKLAQGRRIYDAARAALIERQNGETAKIREAWRQIYADRQQAPYTARRFDRGARAAANDSHAGVAAPIILASAPPARLSDSFRPTASPQEPPTVKPEFERASQLPVANQPPAPERRVSVPAPSPTLTPPGMPSPSHRMAQNVPQTDKAATWARSPEGVKALQEQAQKAAPDAARRAFRPAASPAEPAPAAQQQKPAVRDYWAKTAEPPKQEQPKPTRDYWSKEPSKEKPAAPPRERGRDDYERER